LGGWHDPQGLEAVTLSGVAAVCVELRVSAAPAIKTAAATVAAHITALCTLQYEVAGALAYCIVYPHPQLTTGKHTLRGWRD
jgi:hypothetical protein